MKALAPIRPYLRVLKKVLTANLLLFFGFTACGFVTGREFAFSRPEPLSFSASPTIRHVFIPNLHPSSQPDFQGEANMESPRPSFPLTPNPRFETEPPEAFRISPRQKNETEPAGPPLSLQPIRSEPSSSPESPSIGVIRNDKTNIRLKPSTAAPRIGYGLAGEKALILAQEREWTKLHFEHRGLIGWVRNDLFTIAGQAD